LSRQTACPAAAAPDGRRGHAACHIQISLLLDELDKAYAARPWDGVRIDRIANDLMCLERTRFAQQPRMLRYPEPLAPHDAKSTLKRTAASCNYALRD